MRTSSDAPSDSLAQLAVALAGLGLTQIQELKEIESLKEGEAKPRPLFLVKPYLRFAHHYDLEIGLLIYDEGLGTVGLVYEIPEKAKDLAAEVEHRIDQATYVRYLMLNHARLGQLPLTVELAFLVPKAHLQAVRKALSRVAREIASFLENVGVSLLVLREGGDSFAPADMRRAFPWLLQATRGWFGAQAPSEPCAALDTIELQNYRLPGRRTLTLQSSPVHLVFGQNGSGKSALVEALELAVTGKAERLKGRGDYAGVIRSRRATGSDPARVILHYDDQSKAESTVEAAEGISNALNPKLPATGFRLDQAVMDRLTRGGDTQRAEVFLESFSSAEDTNLLTYQRLRKEAEKERDNLPPVLKELLAAGGRTGEDPEDGMLRQLAWLGTEDSPLPSVFAEACLPLAAANLSALGGLSPELARLHASWSQEPPTVSAAAALLGRIDEAVERLRSSLPGVLDTLRSAREGLNRVEDWQAAGTGGTGRDFLADLNGWLRRCALADLAERHCQFLESLSEARWAGWEPEPNTIGPFVQPPADAAELAALRQQAADWAAERDDLFQRVMTVTPVAGETGRPGSDGVRPSRIQIQRLNSAGRWLQPSAADLPLGQAIEKALDTDNPVQFGDVGVGSGEWAQPLLARLSRLEEAVRALQELQTAAGGRTFQALRDTHARYTALKAAGADVQQSFLRHLQDEPGAQGGRLLEALNELMALFTPRRWDYEDITLKLRDGADGKKELVFLIGESVQAALDLNMAQLNLFTVALFLLCAVHAENRLGLMVLDDPLQNMDELTVTTLARGIAKLSNLWGARWRLLLFFHGQEDRERFRREMPLASYQLPWMSEDTPGGGIVVDAAVFDGGRQCLTEVAEATPRG